MCWVKCFSNFNIPSEQTYDPSRALVKVHISIWEVWDEILVSCISNKFPGEDPGPHLE